LGGPETLRERPRAVAESPEAAGVRLAMGDTVIQTPLLMLHKCLVILHTKYTDRRRLNDSGRPWVGSTVWRKRAPRRALSTCARRGRTPTSRARRSRWPGSWTPPAPLAVGRSVIQTPVIIYF
jgi:hypothetical protein